MDCHAARALLAYAGRPAEGMDPADRAAIRQHLDACPDCAAVAGADGQFDAAVGPAMLTVPVPPALKGNLLVALARQPRPFPYRWAAAVAAAVLLAVGLAGYIAFREAPSLTAEEFIIHGNGFIDAEQVQDWFRQQGVDMEPPREFNFQFLRNYELVKLKGRLVPALLFYDGQSALAQVYVLPSSKQFQLNDDDFPDRGPFSRVVVRRTDDTVYVVVAHAGRWTDLRVQFH